eukprot:15857454-Heterocapsa_arctica.AAC.1
MGRGGLRRGESVPRGVEPWKGHSMSQRFLFLASALLEDVDFKDPGLVGGGYVFLWEGLRGMDVSGGVVKGKGIGFACRYVREIVLDGVGVVQEFIGGEVLKDHWGVVDDMVGGGVSLDPLSSAKGCPAPGAQVRSLGVVHGPSVGRDGGVVGKGVPVGCLGRASQEGGVSV